MSDFVSSFLHRARRRRILSAFRRVVAFTGALVSLLLLCVYALPASAMEQEEPTVSQTLSTPDVPTEPSPAEDTTQPEVPTEPAGEDIQPEDPTEPSTEAAVEPEDPTEPAAEEPGIQSSTQTSNPSVLIAPIPDTELGSGKLSETITWTVTQNTDGVKTLTISGTGDMPNYGKKAEHPWASLGYPSRLVIEEGITSTEAYNFQNYSLSHLSLPSTLTEIKQASFDDSTITCPLVIPGSVKSIGSWAFQGSIQGKIILEEGVEAIAHNAFAIPNKPGNEITLPASLKTYDWDAFDNLTAIHVADGSPYFTSVDGVLFSKDMTVLYHFPKYKNVTEFVVPDTVTEIRTHAFSNSAYLQKLIVPDMTDGSRSLPHNFVVGGSIEEIYIGAGSYFNTNAYRINTCPHLRILTISDEAIIPYHGLLAYNCPKLENYKINKLTTNIYNFYSVPTGLKEFIYDAPNAKFTASNNGGFTSGKQQYNLIVGAHVDNLPTLFTNFSRFAKSVEFDPNNQFAVEAGAFNGAIQPLCDLSAGTYWAGEFGELYQYDALTKTATLVFCPANITTLTVPATITPEEGLTCNVTAVGKNVLAQAKHLTSLSFTGAEAITSVAAVTFTNCHSLATFNGQTTVSQAIATLPNAALGSDPFYGTGLKESASGSDVFTQTGKQELLAGDEAASLYIKASKGTETGTWEGMEDAGYFKQMTGDPLFLNISTQSTDTAAQKVFRIYLQRTHESLEFFEGFQPGATIYVEDQAMSCHSTVDPDIFYLEIAPNPGDTANFTLTFNYPSPTSPGGWLNVWVTELTAATAAASPSAVLPTQSGSICSNWYTTHEIPQYTLSYYNGQFYIFDIKEGSDGLLHPCSQGSGSPNLGWEQQTVIPKSSHSEYGQSYVQTVDYTYTLEFPKGITWNDQVQKAIQNGNIVFSGGYIYADGIQLGLASALSGTSLKNQSMTFDSQGRTVIRWTQANSNPNAQLQESRAYTFLQLKPELMVVDPEQTDPQLSANYRFNAEVTYRYAHGQTETLFAETLRPVIKSTDITVGSEILEKPTFMGEDHTVRVYAANHGALKYTSPEEGVYTLQTEVTNKFYLKPENMEKMFVEDTVGGLTITVKNAQLAPWQEVTGIHGGTAQRNPSNSDLPGVTTGNTLTITHAETGYTVAVAGGSTYTGEHLPTVLKQAGFCVTAETSYGLKWDLNKADETFTVPAGKEISFTVYGTAKDTTQILLEDEQSESDPVTRSMFDMLYAYSPKGLYVSYVQLTNYNRVTLRPDAKLQKTASHDGLEDDFIFRIPDNTVLDYNLAFTHYGDGVYENLPIVDDLFGDQYLLVPVSQNEHHPQLKNLEVYTHGSTDYYILTEGTYRNVVVGLEDGKDWCTADSIVVHRDCNEPTNIFEADLLDGTFGGIHTRIKWYYPTLSAGRYYSVNIRYQAYASSKLGDDVKYDVFNMVWANDKHKSRLYDFFGSGYIILNSEKKILLQRGETPEADTLLENGSSVLCEGDSITYRLMLESGDIGSNYVLNGNELADALPRVPYGFRWEEEDIQIEVVATHPERITGDFAKDWKLTDSFEHLTSEPNQQFLIWDEDVSVTMDDQHSFLYIYVTLTYPSGKEWDSFVAANSGDTLVNKFLILGSDTNVYHDVSETGNVLLQKGVFATQRSNYFYPANTTRSHFSNTSSGDTRFVTYYALIHNDGTKRLYLDTLYDILPAGVTYNTMFSGISGKNTLKVLTYSGKEGRYLDAEEQILYRSATVSAKAEGGKLIFTFGAGEGENAVRYDERMEKYYLDEGEAIVFTYMCSVGDYAKTGDKLLNTLAMPYYDFVSVAPRVSDAVFTAKATDNFPVSDQNNGNCSLLTQEEASDTLNLPTEGSGWWLVSDVTMTRDRMAPGVEKTAEYYSTSGSALIPYEGFALPTATIYWKVTAFNESSSDLRDYTVEDMLPYPYAFQGDITYKVFYADGTQKAEGTLFKVGTRRKNDTSFSLSGSTYTLGSTYSSSGNSFTLTRDGQNEHLTLRFKESSVIIPEKGWVEFLIPTVNVHEVLKSAVYTNRATITVPDPFDPDQVIHGSVVRDSEGKATGVMDSASVITSNIAATTSLKKVTELAHPANTASSSDSIILQDQDSAFRYTLDVTSKVAKGDMDYLTVIDTLPQPGDHSLFDASVPRNSEFTVSLAENPDFSVSLISPDGTETPLDVSQYTLSFHTSKTLFTDDDWRGKAGDWTADAGSARAIRIHIPDASFIPEKGTVRIAFNARIQGEAQLGSVAWNGFGYRYGLRQSLGSVLDLEAMPPDVGVKIPTLPKLQKQLLDYAGQPLRLAEDRAFRFLVYEGEEISGSWNTQAELLALLEQTDRKYEVFSLTVPAGASRSDAQFLNWQWEHGKSYTVTELQDHSDFRFSSFNTAKRNTYSFTYYADRSLSILCTNYKPNWDLKLQKVDAQKPTQGLSGALFALYSPLEQDQLGEAAWDALPVKPQRTVTADGQTWYLHSVTVTSSDGSILWKDLQEESYYLLEVQPPAGYLVNPVPGQIVQRSQSADGVLSVTVQNTAGYRLPNTGSMGTHLFTAAGLALMLPCLLLLLKKRRKT